MEYTSRNRGKLENVISSCRLMFLKFNCESRAQNNQIIQNPLGTQDKLHFARMNRAVANAAVDT